LPLRWRLRASAVFRGRGELLEGLGIGALLPWFNAYAQSGIAHPVAVVLLPGVSFFALASALASGLSDEESDRRGGKTTFATLFGNAFVRRAVLLSFVVGALALVAVPFFAGLPIPLWVTVLPAVVVLASIPRLAYAGRTAVTNAFSAQSLYKGILHRAAWQSSLLLSVLLVLASLR
jgi:4-hydroxybenzoate polyprenyltransferase